MKRILVFLVLSLFPIQAKSGELTFFDRLKVPEPLSYPRSISTGITYNMADVLGYRLMFFEGTIGNTSGVASLKFENSTLQFGMGAGGWFVLGYDDGKYPMIMQDFLFKFPLSFTWREELEIALSYNHISSHLGDDADYVLKKMLSEEEKYQLDMIESNTNLTVIKPVKYSRDYMSLFVAYKYRLNQVIYGRSYIHLGYVHKMAAPKNLDKYFFGQGVEHFYLLKIESVRPYYSHDVTYNQDVDSVDYSGQIGVLFFDKFKVFLSAYIGKDRRGQLLNKKIKQYSVGFQIR
jgi:hypothetical protein